MPPPRDARSTSAKELELSNATTTAFLGNRQKAWMTGGTSTHHGNTLSAKGRITTPSRPDLPGPPNTRPVFDSHQAILNNDPSTVTYNPDYNRGRFPVQRRRRGSTLNNPSRLSTSATSRSLQPPQMLPALEAVTDTSVALDIIPSVSDNVLPSPSPSVEARRHSGHIADLNEVDKQPLPVDRSAEQLQELIAKYGTLDEITKKLQVIESSSSERISQPEAAEGPLPGPPETNVAPSPHSHDNTSSFTSPTSKRVSEDVLQARKRTHPTSHRESETSQTSSARNFSGTYAEIASPPRNPFEEYMRGFAQTVEVRIREVTSMQGRQGVEIERPRLGLLRDACLRSDTFYLCLHQIFCMEYRFRNSHYHLPGLSMDSHREGLKVLTYLLVSNEGLTSEAIDWFSDFPMILDQVLSHPVFRPAYDKTLISLQRMATNWQLVRSYCQQRRYPPLVDELTALFGIPSFSFQEVIFRAVLRDICTGRPEFFNAMEQIFQRNYRDVMSRNFQNSSLDEIEAYNQSIADDYRRIMVVHRQQDQQTQRETMTRPHGGQPRRANWNNTGNLPLQSPSGGNLSFTRTMSQEHAMYAPHYNMSGQDGTIPSGQHMSRMSARQGMLPPRQVPPSIGFPTSHSANAAQLSPTASLTSGTRENETHPQWHRNQVTLGIHGNSSNPQGLQILPSNDSNLGNLSQPIFMPALHDRTVRFTETHGSPFTAAQTSPQTVPNATIQTQESFNDPRVFALPLGSRNGLQRPPLHPNQIPVNRQFIQDYSAALPNPPNPTLFALHQAHVRSPILKTVDNLKLFRFIKSVAMPPKQLCSSHRHVAWDLVIPSALIESLAKDTSEPCGAPPTRNIQSNSQVCRIRCIKTDRAVGLPSESEWVAADNIWPSSTAVVFNGKALEIRKKSHHGKDLPIDATPFVKEGKNDFSTAIIGFPNDEVKYAIGFEIIRIAEEQVIKDLISPLAYQEARQRVLARSSQDDPDVEVVQSQTVIDLTDPFTSRIFDVPIRGTSCRHNQCFDRDTFLQTRHSKNQNQKDPCGPDEFRCPICSADARPQSLVVDGFFVAVRETLEQRGRLDVKAIILDESGNWEIKEEEEGAGETGDGSGEKPNKHAKMGSESRARSTRNSTPQDVVLIDDDG